MDNNRISPDKRISGQAGNGLSDVVVSVDSDLRCRYVSQSAEEVLDKTESELIGEVIWEVFPQATNTVAQDKIEKALYTNEEVRFEWSNESLDRWFDVRAFPATDGLSIILNDITDWQARGTKPEIHEQIMEMLPVAVAQDMGEDEGEFEYVTQGFVDLFELESKEASKQYAPADFCADPQEQKTVKKKIQATGEIHAFELELEKPGGERFWGSASASIETIGGEEYFIGFVQDITERREYKQMLRDLHDATREMVSASTPEGVADIITRTADQSIGYEMNGVHFYDDSVEGLAPVSVSETSKELIGGAPVLDHGIAWTAFQTGNTQVCNDLTEADTVYNEETVLQSELAIPIGDHGVLLASDTEIAAFRGDDLTLIKILAKNAETALNRLQTENELRDSEQELARQREFLKQTQEVAYVGGWEVDMRTESVKWTDEVHRIHGQPLEYQPTIEDGLSFYHPDDRDAIEDAVDRVTTEAEPFDLELRIVWDTGDVRWVRTRGEPWVRNGELVGARGTLQDITGRKERQKELRKQNERLEEFASLVSHDLRNPLTVALGRTTFLQQEYDGESAEQLDVIVKSLNRMEQIIDGTLTLAQKGQSVGDMQPVSLPELCGNCWQRVDTPAGALDFDDEITLKGDANRLKHVFENLFRNAVEHGSDSVTVSIGRIDDTSFYVEDDGRGIPPDDRDEVFEAGETSEIDGTGLGLAIVKRISEAHGWEVTVTEGSDGGARFVFSGVEFTDI